MSLELRNPETLSTPESYTHVVVGSGRLVFVAGQVADDVDGSIVGPGDFGAQAEQAFANVGRALAAVGARPQDVAKLTIFVVGLGADHLPGISKARTSVFGDHRPADTLVGVETLAEPGFLIEVEAIALLAP